MKKPRLPDFAGKLVAFIVNGYGSTLAMDNPRLELQGSRWFVTGIVPQGVSAGDWSADATLAVAWDQINHYLIFDSADHYRKRLKKYADLKKSKRKA